MSDTQPTPAGAESTSLPALAKTDFSGLPPDSLYYLMSPFSEFPGGPGAGFALAVRALATLTERDLTVFSPIAHYFPPNQLRPRGLATSRDYALHNNRIICRCDAGIFLDVGEASGRSLGMRAERELLLAQAKPVWWWKVGEGKMVRVLPGADSP